MKEIGDAGHMVNMRKRRICMARRPEMERDAIISREVSGCTFVIDWGEKERREEVVRYEGQMRGRASARPGSRFCSQEPTWEVHLLLWEVRVSKGRREINW